MSSMKLSFKLQELKGSNKPALPFLFCNQTWRRSLLQTTLLCITRSGRDRAGVIGEGCHKYHFCRDKRFAACVCFVTLLLSRQKYVLSRQKYVCFVATKVCVFFRDNFFTRLLLSRQKRVYCGKTSVATKVILASFCFDNTRLLSRQTNYVCRGKYLSWQ